jgi:hypothetical protein
VSLLALSPASLLAQEHWQDDVASEAPENTPSFAGRPLRLHIKAGTGTIVGNLGITASYDVHDSLGLGLGFGANPRGIQEALFGRWRPYIGQGRSGLVRAIAIEVALSSGPGSGGYIPAGEAAAQPFRWARISWIQLEAQYEVLRASGFDFVTGLGLGIPVESTEPVCIRSSDLGGCANESRSPLPALSLSAAIGYSIW